MRRQNLQLLSAMRQGDVAARCEVGRRYLLGIEGFPKHPQTGLAYLTHPSTRGLTQAAIALAEGLAPEQLMRTPHGDLLRQAAFAGSTLAQLRLAAWEMTRPAGLAHAAGWIATAANAGSLPAREFMLVLPVQRATPQAALRLLARLTLIDGVAVALAAARTAAEERDLMRLVHCLQIAVDLAGTTQPAICELVGMAVRLAEEMGHSIALAEPAIVQACLEHQSQRGNLAATYALGRALAGITCGCLAPSRLAVSPNLRKGTALLLRAADAGQVGAWLHLHRLHAEGRSSIANPQMARFFLEKAAAAGYAVAQRKIGALQLREADHLVASEQAIHWLFQAAAQDDGHARNLLRSLVLPLEGSDVQAWAVIDELQRLDPCLAQRLQLSRHFGLTKLEALTVDPCSAERPWGLVAGCNPFVVQARRTAPRAIPALTRRALQDLRAAAAFFERTVEDGGLEADLRRRAQRQRSIFEIRGIDERMFFATATSTRLECLRQGPKWAARSKAVLRLALAD
jgi:TPR repeat protein